MLRLGVQEKDEEVSELPYYSSVIRGIMANGQARVKHVPNIQ